MKICSLKLSEIEASKDYKLTDLTLKPLSVFKDTISFEQDALTKYNKQEYIDEFISFIPMLFLS